MFNPNEHMMDLKGKQYLQVMWRLVWFRDEHPDWGINTESIRIDDSVAIFRAMITDESGRCLSTGFGSEAPKDFRDYIEKAETKAIGRALAMLGYGTQFAPELDEGERIVDSPVPKRAEICERCGNPVIDISYKGDKYTVADILAKSRGAYNGVFCWNCMSALKRAQNERGN